MYSNRDAHYLNATDYLLGNEFGMPSHGAYHDSSLMGEEGSNQDTLKNTLRQRINARLNTKNYIKHFTRLFNSETFRWMDLQEAMEWRKFEKNKDHFLDDNEEIPPIIKLKPYATAEILTHLGILTKETE